MSGIYFCSKKSNQIRLSAEGFDMYRHSDRFFSFIKPATHYKLTIGKIQSVGRCDLLMRISDWALSIPMNATSQMHAATNLNIYSINRQTVKQTDWTSATLMYRSSTLRCIVWAVIYQGNLSATPSRCGTTEAIGCRYPISRSACRNSLKIHDLHQNRSR